MSDRVLAWVLRLTWAAVPFTVWPALGEALRAHSGAVRTTASLGAWALWAVVLLATLVPHPVGLTVLRSVAPAMVVAVVVAVATGVPSDPASVAAAGWAAIVAIASFLPGTGILFVNGPAYPNERRFPLGVPAALFLGPIELAWAAVVGLPVAAALLLASRQWLAGGVLAMVAAGSVWVLGRALYGLSRRWAVLVPAGLVLHDLMSLAEPVLFRQQIIESLGPAPVGSDSLDLTQRAAGLALELRLREKVPLVRITLSNRRGEPGSSARLLFSPTRPGAVLAAAAARRITVDVAPPAE